MLYVGFVVLEKEKRAYEENFFVLADKKSKIRASTFTRYPPARKKYGRQGINLDLPIGANFESSPWHKWTSTDLKERKSSLGSQL